MNVEGSGYGFLRCYPGIYLKGLRKLQKTSHDSGPPVCETPSTY